MKGNRVHWIRSDKQDAGQIVYRSETNHPLPWYSFIAGLLFFLVSGSILENSVWMRQLKFSLQQVQVPASLIDYGSRGVLLKRLGLLTQEETVNGFGLKRNRTFKVRSSTPFELDRYYEYHAYTVCADRSIRNSVFSAPCHVPDDIMENTLQRGIPAISMQVSPGELLDRNSGLYANASKRGPGWEKSAEIQYFEEGQRKFKALAGVRLHGGATRIKSSEYPSFRIYFRNRYGDRSGFEGIDDQGRHYPINTIVIHHGAPEKRFQFTNLIAMEIARKTGCIVPAMKPVDFFLNGRLQDGVYYISEHVNPGHWKDRLGTDRFDMYVYRGDNGFDIQQVYQDSLNNVLKAKKTPDFTDLCAMIDVNNLINHVFSIVFCGTGDWDQGAVYRLKTRNGSRSWHWINWDMDFSFGRLGREDSKSTPDDPFAWELIFERDYMELAALFTKLSKESPEFVELLVKKVTETLNHRITLEFLDELLSRYEDLAARLKLLDDKTRQQFKELSEFLHSRHQKIRMQMVEKFGVGEYQKVSIHGPSKVVFTIDGFQKKGDYTGYYPKFMGLTVEVQGSASGWSVNGHEIKGKILGHVVKGPVSIIIQ